MEIYFSMAIRMLFLYMKPLLLSVFHFFSVNRKRIVLLTLFCLLKNRNNGNFTVPIHKIPVMALLIIRIINFRFRFKRGNVYPRLSVKVVGNTFIDRCGITAPRICVETITPTLVYTVNKFPTLFTHKKKT